MWADSSYEYKKKITIDNTITTSDEVDFPILISITDNDLKDIANSGHVQSSSGYDIVFYDSTEMVLLSHEIESYTASTGVLIYWVKVPSLSSTSITTIYIYYGKVGVGSDPSTTNTWDTNFIHVWHMDGTGDVDDSIDGNNGTNNGSDQITGKIGDGRDFISTNNDYIDYGDMAQPCDDSLNVATIEFWFNPDSVSAGKQHYIINKYNSPVTKRSYYLAVEDGKLTCIVYKESPLVYWGYKMNGVEFVAGSWQYGAVVFTFASENMDLYDNGAEKASTKVYDSGTGPSVFYDMDQTDRTGMIRYGTATYSDFSIDELRISKTARSVGWVNASFNSQNNPSSYLIVLDEDVLEAKEITEVAYHTKYKYGNEVYIDVAKFNINEVKVRTIDV